MKKLLLILAIITGFLWAYTTFASSNNFNGCSGMGCFIEGVKDASEAIGPTGVVTGKGISEAVQEFIIYLLSFLSLIAVIYVMYAGAQLLLNPADEESAAKTKKIIIGVISGIVIIWFAWWIVSTLLFVIKTSTQTSFIPTAIAETQIRNVDFTTYSNQIQALRTQLDTDYSPEVMTKLSSLVEGAYDHLPDRDDLYKNKQLYDDVKKAINSYNVKKETFDQGVLKNALRKFLEEAAVYIIKSEPEATPRIGDAPLSVTFEAKRTIDESGTVLPDDNYIWWLRTEGGIKKELGRGHIINYTFEKSGTYMVFLTINSASKNSRGFVDVISFEENVVVEVGQPKVQFAVRINDQLADKVVKISTKEAKKPIRIDASETRFASGYTTKSTEWDFGNGKSDTNDGNPQFESQLYEPGEYTIRLTLMRNDGEEFSYNILLKIGDPLASISTVTKQIHKGEKTLFQAKKISSENDVQYLWEVKRQGIDDILYTVTGTRLEYVFGDTGKFFITLTSIKGDALDKETLEVDIESRPPNVQFTSETVSPEMPNVYMFDGSNSFDPDYPDNQKLRFEWFVDDTAIQLTETNAKNSRGKYAFPEKGNHRVTLRVTDEDGKTKESKRDIKITSILSAKLDMRPAIVKRGAKVLLSVTAPLATKYEWKIGNNDPVATENNRFVTSLPTSGTFPISVTVTNADGDTTTATEKIYVTEDDQPFSIIDIKSDSSLIISQKSVCSGQEAITLDRANPVSFSAERSVNRDGYNNELTYYWKIGLNKISTQKNVSYTFDEIGCEEISLTVSDKSGASHTTKKWVKVVNLAPVFNDIQVKVENLDMDPMKIDLKITGAKDPDGLIRSYTWYYYTDKDDQAQGFRITSVPEASFALPKITGRYYFAVLMEDSNGLKINTKEVSDVLFSTPDLYINTNLATPIIENFQANTSEVVFGELTRLSLDVRTPVASDVSEKSEYRWDIDGDGFYDVKTTTPFYEFIYKYPGEYNPKVKVTHKGVSSTKSLTIFVKNRLVPKATIQMMGNKIIAYNVSSGIFQSANWYLDDKKISENKDYLISEIEGSDPHNLKLEISDGKVTESHVYPIQSSVKNKVLLKKISRPLVILSPLSGNDAVETPDEIVWEDPMTPLYLYLGESRGDNIRYYAIDTDIAIDTDLSGGKDDDADNRGTASYRSGRPFQIPKGTKRVTVMKIWLIGTNNQDLDTRQIRVTRTFLANTEPDLIEDTRAPKTFNLSQEDKDRIEKLRNLVQSAPKEEKAEFDKILDQLGDNWYDVAERIQTLNLFSNRVNESPTLSADLKKKILEQISIVYTQGDEAMEEKQLAFKMITEYLAKSTKKAQIFGDADKPGLINDIIDNPEYYEANLKIIQKIMDDYVSPDTTLSPEVKKDIKEKLMILAGSPPAPPVGEIDPNTVPVEKSNLTILLWILGGIMCIIFGTVGVIYARKKLVHQDGTKTPEGNTIAPDMSPISSTQSTDVANPVLVDSVTQTPDWLKEESSPFGDEDVFSSESATSGEIQQPDWLKDTTASPAETTGETNNTPAPMTSSTDAGVDNDVASPEGHDIPDWLQQESPAQDEVGGDAVTPVSGNTLDQGVENIATPSEVFIDDTANTLSSDGDVQNIADDAPSEGSTPSLVTSQQDDDVPDWLRGAESLATAEPVTSADISGALEDEETITQEEVLIEDIPSSVKQEASENDGKKSKKETIASDQELPSLESPENLLESPDDALLSPPEKKTTKKKKTTSKPKTVPSDHLLAPEHDMLLSDHTQDNPL